MFKVLVPLVVTTKYFGASLVAQLIRNFSAMQEIVV